MFIYKVSDKLVFNILNRATYGYLEITCFDGTQLKFGNQYYILYSIDCFV